MLLIYIFEKLAHTFENLVLFYLSKRVNTIYYP